MTTNVPILSTIQDATDFSHVVPALYYARDHLLSFFTGKISFHEFYTASNPLASAFILSNILGAYTLVLAEVTGNYSQVDRLWSLLPTIYTVHFATWAHLNNLETSRMDLIALVTILWSARLTFNYWRKGGYTVGSEDYRWEVIKEKIGRVPFFILNITFISWMQNWLLLSVATPVYLFLLVSNSFPKEERSFGPTDIAFASVLIGVLATEFTADQQQWDYQTAKKSYKETNIVPQGYTKTDLDRGFNVRGLWAYSRHPNFASEQSIWCIIYAWGCYVTGTYYNWTFWGAASYLALFQGSTWLTELFTADKYPEYATYQKKVGKFFPSPFFLFSKPYTFVGAETQKTK